MNSSGGSIYVGTVAHTRLRPRLHRLRYRVFSCLFDCNQLDRTSRRLRLFSYNRGNLFSLHDRDHGDGSPICSYLEKIAKESGLASDVKRFSMLCYPRILGYAFNPLTVYFGFDEGEAVRLIVYEVNNTFGERKTYVLRADENAAGVISQECRKEFYVSPFNPASGQYSFHVTPPGEELTVGVALRDADGPVLKAYFRGARRSLNDGGLIRAFFQTGWMTMKVTFGIHYEAVRLWLKGVRLVSRPPAPESPITYVDNSSADKA